MRKKIVIVAILGVMAFALGIHAVRSEITRKVDSNQILVNNNK